MPWQDTAVQYAARPAGRPTPTTAMNVSASSPTKERWNRANTATVSTIASAAWTTATDAVSMMNSQDGRASRQR